jgi:prepilin peptidase dependent protein B
MLKRSPLFVRPSRGLSLVELMVGMVVGLFIVGGAAYFTVNFNADNRRLLLEARLTQDMRAAMDIVTRDLRRAGYWQNAASGVGVSGGTATTTYNDAGFGVMSSASAPTSVSYYYDRNGAASASAGDAFGFDLNGNVLRTKIGAAASQPLTDEQTVKVETFSVTLDETIEDLASRCSKTCITDCPKVYVRDFTVTMTASAAVDPTVKRTLRNKVRVRNDKVTGACPV